jgi:cell division transport system ATP-binding protein
MIALHGVSKVFGMGPARIHALSDVSFRIEKGEFAVLHGRSGAGKTTLLRLLYRDEVPTEGAIRVGDFDLPGLPRRRVPGLRRMIGVVFQDAKLLPGRTVSENIAFVLRVLGTPRRDITERTSAALRAVGLSARAHVYPAHLSQGEAQRAALARAIAKEPPLLLADEPTGNLDDEISGEILDLVTDFWMRGTTVLVATHQANVVRRLRRRTLMLQNGRLLRDERWGASEWPGPLRG